MDGVYSGISYSKEVRTVESLFLKKMHILWFIGKQFKEPSASALKNSETFGITNIFVCLEWKMFFIKNVFIVILVISVLISFKTGWIKYSI